MNVTHEISDEQLMQQCIAGDHVAFNAFLERHLTGIKRFAMRMVGEVALAEDIAQDVFVKIWKDASMWKPTGSAKAWVYQIAYRRSIDAIRKRKMHPDIDEMEYADKAQNAEQHNIAREEKAMLNRAMDDLPERQRTALVLFHYQELSQKEVALAMDDSESAVESLLYRARKTLKEAIQFAQEEVDYAA